MAQQSEIPDKVPFIPGVKVLNMGEIGTGKTTVLRSIADCGLEVIGIFTENGQEIVGMDSRIKWRYIPPASPSWNTMIDAARKINTLSNDSLQKLAGIEKGGYTQFIDMLECMHNFKLPDGTSLGPIDSWMTDRCFFLDSLTGLGQSSMNLAVGAKPIKTQPDWGVAMDNLGRLVDKLVLDLKCHFYMTAHIEMERDEISGANKIMVSTLGRKLAPTLPRFFSDVILSTREGNNFNWSTNDSRAALKTRNLPMQHNIKQDFRLILDHWKQAGGVILPSPGVALVK